MVISGLIEHLLRLQEEHGDLPCFLEVNRDTLTDTPLIESLVTQETTHLLSLGDNESDYGLEMGQKIIHIGAVGD